MALYRAPIECTNCGHKNSFINNPMTEMQKLTGFCGDNGGKYPTICEKCKQLIFGKITITNN